MTARVRLREAYGSRCAARKLKMRASLYGQCDSKMKERFDGDDNATSEQ